MKSFTRVFLAGLLACSAACAGDVADQPKTTSAPAKMVDAATAGSIGGVIKFEGAPPAGVAVKLSKDCVANAGPNPQSEAVMVSADGGLQNAFVYVKAGLDPSYTFDAPAGPVELDQKGCIYTPRVLGVRVGQSIDIVNSDATMHNVHAIPMVNQEFNKSQPTQNSHMLRVFTAPEVMVRFVCNVHNWMASYVGVMENPYFAVTDAAGHFEIKNLPPGTYTVEAWHEKFGRKTVQITVAERQAQTMSLAFTAAPAENK